MRKCYARFGIGGGEGDLIADHTGSRKRNVAQKGERRWKRGSLIRKNLFRKRESKAKTSAHLAEQTEWQGQQVQTGRLMSANPPEDLKNQCLLRFWAFHMTHLSYLLFQLLVLTSRKAHLRAVLRELITRPGKESQPTSQAEIAG